MPFGVKIAATQQYRLDWVVHLSIRRRPAKHGRRVRAAWELLMILRASRFNVASIVLVLLAAGSAFAAGLQASAKASWTEADAAHLLRRAGFSGTPEQIAHLTALGRDGAVDLLVEYDRFEQTEPGFPVEIFAQQPPRGMLAKLDRPQRQAVTRAVRMVSGQTTEAIRDWWLSRMITTARPLEEKMVLFWHGHFTSGIREVRNPRYMQMQNAFLRKHALGNFKAMVHGISRDPAMLIYLDNARNVKANPNENYARELLELFTMGEGNYTEQDIKEAARAFTGWTIRGAGRKYAMVEGDRESLFFVSQRQHDDGEKTFLGQTGAFDGDDIIDIIFEQPATARFLANKLWTYFVEPEPSDATINEVAALIRKNDYELKPVMRAIFKSDAFYAPSARFSLIKSPTELTVGTFRMLDASPGDMTAANRAMAQMGQELLQPPNVRGWVGGRTWINTSTLFQRYNAAAGIINGTRGQGAKMQERSRMRLVALGVGEANDDERMTLDEEMTDRMEKRGKARKTSNPQAARDTKASIEDLPEEVRDWLGELQWPPSFSDAQPVYDPLPVIEKHKLTTAASIVDHYVQRLLQSELPTDRRDELIAVLSPEGGDFNARSPQSLQRARQMIHLIMSTPEYQVY